MFFVSERNSLSNSWKISIYVDFHANSRHSSANTFLSSQGLLCLCVVLLCICECRARIRPLPCVSQVMLWVGSCHFKQVTREIPERKAFKRNHQHFLLWVPDYNCFVIQVFVFSPPLPFTVYRLTVDILLKVFGVQVSTYQWFPGLRTVLFLMMSV